MSALRHYAFALPSRQLSTLEQICASERGVDRFETDGRIVHALLRKQLIANDHLRLFATAFGRAVCQAGRV